MATFKVTPSIERKDPTVRNRLDQLGAYVTERDPDNAYTVEADTLTDALVAIIRDRYDGKGHTQRDSVHPSMYYVYQWVESANGYSLRDTFWIEEE